MELVLFIISIVCLLAISMAFISVTWYDMRPISVPGALVPPLAMIFYVLRSPNYNLMAVVHFASFFAFLFAFMLTTQSNPRLYERLGMKMLVADQVGDQTYRSTSLADFYIAETDLDKIIRKEDAYEKLLSRINGQLMEWNDVEYDGKQLRFKSSNEVFSEYEVAVDVSNLDVEQGSMNVTFGRSSKEGRTKVFVTQRNSANEVIDSRMLNHHFEMSLNFSVPEKTTENSSGYIKLLLKDAHGSFIVGNFKTTPLGLHTFNGEFDPSYDSPQTLRRVATGYVKYEAGLHFDKILGYKNIKYQTGLDFPSASMEVTVHMIEGYSESWLIKMGKSDGNWVVSESERKMLKNNYTEYRPDVKPILQQHDFNADEIKQHLDVEDALDENF